MRSVIWYLCYIAGSNYKHKADPIFCTRDRVGFAVSIQNLKISSRGSLRENPKSLQVRICFHQLLTTSSTTVCESFFFHFSKNLISPLAGVGEGISIMTRTGTGV